jgi:beta-glucosidase
MTSRRFVVPALALCALAAAATARSDSAWLAGQDAKVDALLAKMTLDEKVGQMTQADASKVKDLGDVSKYFLGSILNGGGEDPAAGNSLEAWTAHYDTYQSAALKTRLKIPILFGIDAVHGHNNVLGATVFPHNVGLGCTRNPALVQRAAEVTAEEVRATGIQWTFAPMVAVVRDERWGRTYEGFGESTELSRDMGVAAVRGFQGSSPRDPKRVLACAKHFVGDGATTFGTGPLVKKEGSPEHWPIDQGDTKLTEAELKSLLLPPYVAAIEAGVGTVMISYNTWNGVRAHASRRLMTDILKGELGFRGFLISDWAGIDSIPGDYRSDVETSINAGMDMVMVPDKYPEFYNTLKSLVEEKRIPMSRIDDAVRRILRVKAGMGMLDEGASLMADRKLHASFGSAEHRAVARDAVRQSLVLLKNEGKTLPLAKSARIHVAGRNADDIGNQCGGWTVEWQGKSGPVMTGGTTILQAVRDAVGTTGKVTFSVDGSGAEGAPVAVAVIGETPYAEMQGDRSDLALDPADVATVKALKKSGARVVVVLVTGRPMILDSILADADAIVAAWLPGTEGAGVADVLFGDYKPTGKLSYSWPRSMAQLPINVGDAKYDPLFPFGFGLTY